MKQIRKRLTYANVMSSIAVFLILGGATAFAVSKVPNKSVGTKQLKANAVTTAKIKKGAITSQKIKDNAVTGAKVNESTLGQVPSAASATKASVADNANAVNGLKISKVFFRVPDNTGTTNLFSGNGLNITSSCSGANDVALTATTTKGKSSIYSIVNGDAEPTPANPFEDDEENNEFELGEDFDLLAGGDGNINFVQFEYDALDGSVVTGVLAVDEDGDNCKVSGYVTS